MLRGYKIKTNVCPLLNNLNITQARNEFYFNNKHIQIPVTNENRRPTV